MSLPKELVPAELNLTIVQGSGFFRTVTLVQPDGNPMDLIGVTAEAQIRSDFPSTSIIASILCTVTDPSNGVLTMELTHAETSALVSEGDNNYGYVGVWDLELDDTTYKVRPLKGKVTLDLEVTR